MSKKPASKKKNKGEKKGKLEPFWNEVVLDNRDRSETMMAYVPGGVLIRTRSFAMSVVDGDELDYTSEALVFVPINE